MAGKLLSDIVRALESGAVLRHTWKTGAVRLVLKNGEEQRVDGRTYHALVHSPQWTNKLRESRSGDSDTGDLVMEWRMMPSAAASTLPR